MTRITCRTNLDLHPLECWPDELPESPIVGDTILSGWSGVALKVVSRTWIKRGDEYILEVELHDRSARSISDFEKWYKGFLNARLGVTNGGY